MKLYPAGITAMPAGARDVVHHDEASLMRRLQELLG